MSLLREENLQAVGSRKRCKTWEVGVCREACLGRNLFDSSGNSITFSESTMQEGFIPVVREIVLWFPEKFLLRIKPGGETRPTASLSQDHPSRPIDRLVPPQVICRHNSLGGSPIIISSIHGSFIPFAFPCSSI